MLQFLQRQKAKKGFTIIELIVVIAVIAVLMAIILPQMSTQRARINEARSAARDFYAAIQTVMNYFSVFDGRLLSDDLASKPGEPVNKDEVIHYYKVMGGNYPLDPNYRTASPGELDVPDVASMYIMVHAWNNTIQDVGIVTRAADNTKDGNGMLQLLKRDENDRNTEFGNILAGEINHRVSFNDGWYYARVDFVYSKNTLTGEPENIKLQPLKVEYTAFCHNELPQAPAEYDDNYINSITFTKDYVLRWNSGEICGVCAEWYEQDGKFTSLGLAGTRLE